MSLLNCSFLPKSAHKTPRGLGPDVRPGSLTSVPKNPVSRSGLGRDPLETFSHILPPSAPPLGSANGLRPSGSDLRPVRKKWPLQVDSVGRCWHRLLDGSRSDAKSYNSTWIAAVTIGRIMAALLGFLHLCTNDVVFSGLLRSRVCECHSAVVLVKGRGFNCPCP